jgi:NADH-quinone oxidoreductase subunit N
MTVTAFDWNALAPSLVLLATLCVALVFDMGSPVRWARPTGWAVVVGMLVSGVVACAAVEDVAISFGARQGGALVSVFKVDAYTRGFTVIFLLGGMLSALLSMEFLRRHEIERGEYYILLVASLLGMVLMAGANDLLLVFLGLELLSLPLYILAGFLRDARSSESSLKYFVLGAFSSAIFLYGMALVYGAVGSTNLEEIARSAGPSPLLRAGIALLVVGFGFKAAAVPFHQWAPDVYQGAPTPATAFFMCAPKVAAFAGLVRVFIASPATLSADWRFVFALLAAATMTVGNLVALTQTNVKRMLAYSSIAQAGYVLVALAAGAAAVQSAMFYLLAYTLMTVGAFGVLILNGFAAGEGDDDERLMLEDFAGLGLRRPVLGAAMAVLMLSLTGFPPTVGFIGKFLIFRDAYDAGLTWLVVVGVLNSVVSAFFYLGIVVQMYMVEPRRVVAAEKVRTVGRGLVVAVLVLAVVGVLWGGSAPTTLMRAARMEAVAAEAGRTVSVR